ncbi:MAG: DUF58 domain-containing protein [Sinomicrobium sp.]|nr:DUF58 domain-containing protein [Sinomicrobium sp.]
MKIQSELQHLTLANNLALLANQVVEGFISGMHKSPFHGFSSEFAEYKSYNLGESIRYIDWKLFARTDKLYTRRYEEETNLRCHIIIDNSSSMHYPANNSQTLMSLNKIGFSVLAAAALIQLLKRQRDAVGLSIYSDAYDYYAPEKGNERHRQMLISVLEETVNKHSVTKQTKTHTFLHQIAEKMHRRSMIFLFTDMFQTETDEDALFDALRHLKYNKHKVVLFHVMDKAREFHFDFDDRPKRFTDVETGKFVNLYADAVKENYENAVEAYFDAIKLKCARYKIKYVETDIAKGIQKVLFTYLVEGQKFR